MAKVAKQKKEESKALIEDYPIARMNPEELQETFEDNLMGDFDPFSLEQITMPAGGARVWTLEGTDGEEVTPNTFQGVIVAWHKTRKYWEVKYDERTEVTKPDCYSPDGVHGYGNPGGLCNKCPFSQFIDDKQPCRDERTLYVLREGQVLPSVLTLPPTSIAPVRKYFRQLASRTVSFYKVITNFSLEQKQNKQGIKYSVLKPEMELKLHPDEVDLIKNYSDTIKNLIKGMSIEQIDDEFIAGEWKEGARESFEQLESGMEKEGVAYMSWEGRIPEEPERRELFSVASARQFYIMMRDEYGVDNADAKKMALEWVGLPPADDLSMKDVLMDADARQKINIHVYEEKGKVMFQ